MAGRLDFQSYPSVEPTGAPGDDYERIQTSSDMFGGAIARGAETLGQGIEHAGEAGIEASTARNSLTNEVHASEVNSWFADQVSDKWSTFSQLQGKAALDARPQFNADVEQLRQQAIGQVKSPQEQARLAASLRNLSDSYYRYGANHADQQFNVYANKVATDQKQSFGAQALVAATQDGDPGAVNHMYQALYSSDDAVRKFGEQNHWDEDTIAQEVAKNRGSNLKVITSALISDGRLDKASQIFGADRDGIDAVSQAEITRMLHAPLTARRVSTAASLATGTPVDPQHFQWTEQSAGLPIGYIGRTMSVESGMGRVHDRPGSQYQGLGQFGTAERLKYGITDPTSITQNANALVQEAETNLPALGKALGRQPTAAELYLAHQQGVGGAVAQLSNPDKPAWQNLAATSEGRSRGADWAKTAIWGNMTVSAKAAFGSVDNVTGSDFVRVVKGFYGGGAGNSATASAAGAPGAPAAADGSGVINRPQSYQRAQVMFGDNPVFLRQVETEIDRVWGEQRKVSEERIGEIGLAMPNIVSAMADGHLEAEKDVPSDLGLLGAKQAEDWQERIAAAKVLGARVGQLPMATPGSIDAMRDELRTGLGETSPLYKFQKDIVGAYDKAVNARQETLKKDPATYVLNNDTDLKATFDAAEKAGTPQAMQAFAQQMLARQDYLGVAPDQRHILPADYTASLAARWRDPARLPPPQPGEAGGAGAVINEIQGTARLYGDYWPDVYREIAPKLDPVLRAVAAGGEPAALTRLLNDKALPIGKILASEDDTKDSDLKKDVVDALKLFGKTVSGSERSQTLSDYIDVTHRLAARYVSEDQDPTTAARQAAKDLLDYNYNFVDESQAHFRVPKRETDGRPFAFAPNDIAAGAEAARQAVGKDELAVAPKADAAGRGLSDSYLGEQTIDRVKSDGVWLTSPDEKGLVLFQPNGFAVRKADGSALFLPWADLAQRGRDKNAQLAQAMKGSAAAVTP
jgi:hypothetical protein